MNTRTRTTRLSQINRAPRKQRHGILFGLFAVWVLAIPFHRYSVISTYSLDNLLAPFLFIAAILLPSLRDRVLASYRFKILGLALVFYFVSGSFGMFKFLSQPELLKPYLWSILRNGFYFALPMLYIRDLWSFRVMKQLLIWVAMAGALSVFLVALGVIELPVERFAESRIASGLLPKSVGLFSNYGDLSILYGFVSVLLLSHGHKELGMLGRRSVKIVLWLGLLAGLAGAQSRNMLFGTVIAMMVYLVWNTLLVARGSQRTAVVGLFVAGVIIVPGVLAVFSDFFVATISNLGGAKAENTALERLQSYSLALELISQEPLGLGFQTYKAYQGLANHIHNMWIKLLLNKGIFGMAAIAALFYLAYKGGSKPARSPVLSIEPALVVASAAALFIAVEFYPGESDMMWVVLGTLISFNWVRMERPAIKRTLR